MRPILNFPLFYLYRVRPGEEICRDIAARSNIIGGKPEFLIQEPPVECTGEIPRDTMIRLSTRNPHVGAHIICQAADDGGIRIDAPNHDA